MDGGAVACSISCSSSSISYLLRSQSWPRTSSFSAMFLQCLRILETFIKWKDHQRRSQEKQKQFPVTRLPTHCLVIKRG
ncbi:unnamed protein product [Orchesella dallaii]|uniref:Uncharacterized protein n=1 Tax=Orchesella dallaii TaxID=48710 RepID=A0ABP1Q4E3_9HEXA